MTMATPCDTQCESLGASASRLSSCSLCSTDWYLALAPQSWRFNLTVGEPASQWLRFALLCGLPRNSDNVREGTP